MLLPANLLPEPGCIVIADTKQIIHFRLCLCTVTADFFLELKILHEMYDEHNRKKNALERCDKEQMVQKACCSSL